MKTDEMVAWNEKRAAGFQAGKVVRLDGNKEAEMHNLAAQRLRDLDAMLRGFEWTRETRGEVAHVDYCRICGNHKEIGHAKGCHLAALLEGPSDG